MKKTVFGLLIMFAFAVNNQIYAQGKTAYKFGKISLADFEIPGNTIDSGAGAVIISDIGSTSFEGNNHQGFDYVFTRYLRVKIVKKAGVNVGTFLVSLYHTNAGLSDNNAGYLNNGINSAFYERLSSLRGSTFNVENGTITETKLDPKSVYEEKYNKNYINKKFSLPALKEGSVFDLEYTIKSPFDGQLPEWKFQNIYPCLWNEFVLTIPPPYHYMMNYQGDQHFDIQTQRVVYGSFSLKRENGTMQSDEAVINANSIELRWVKKNVPGIHEEPFVSNPDNYLPKVYFQLNYFQWKTAEWTGDRQDYMANWDGTTKTLLQEEDFGLALDHVNNWMTSETKDIVSGAVSEEEKAQRLYIYVRDNFKVSNKEGYGKEGIRAISSLKEVFNSKTGNVAEINLLLTAMLRHEGLKADPVILSTRQHGTANPNYPTLTDYNYLIAIVYIDGRIFPLDATRPFSDFGQLSENCYNGYAHIMNRNNPAPLLLSPDSVFENQTTSVFINNDEKGISSGTMKTIYGKSRSYHIREQIAGSSLKEYEKSMENTFTTNLIIDNFSVDSLKKFYFPLSVSYDINLKKIFSGDIAYFDPMMQQGYRKNPFVSMERQYPIDMPYKIDDLYILNFEIPTGFQVDELPASVKVAYNGNEGSFEYLIQKGESNIQMRVHLKFNKAHFATEDYANLRDFFAYVVKKESEQVVFKKIK